ncbi:hypothetical protein CC78DRAFT_576714 [Lojkania enalia]|uniref:Uncharacterized protein n=1 Tax=Lojkania enalia TaxID=147567 RepID=A0A9P4KIZ3_9PLEO|nr:hypothetical protein CC78DRAFT_576714 [Didymosphaeria enalia]
MPIVKQTIRFGQAIDLEITEYVVDGYMVKYTTTATWLPEPPCTTPSPVLSDSDKSVSIDSSSGKENSGYEERLRTRGLPATSLVKGKIATDLAVELKREIKPAIDSWEKHYQEQEKMATQWKAEHARLEVEQENVEKKEEERSESSSVSGVDCGATFSDGMEREGEGEKGHHTSGSDQDPLDGASANERQPPVAEDYSPHHPAPSSALSEADGFTATQVPKANPVANDIPTDPNHADLRDISLEARKSLLKGPSLKIFTGNDYVCSIPLLLFKAVSITPPEAFSNRELHLPACISGRPVLYIQSWLKAASTLPVVPELSAKNNLLADLSICRAAKLLGVEVYTKKIIGRYWAYLKNSIPTYEEMSEIESLALSPDDSFFALLVKRMTWLRSRDMIPDPEPFAEYITQHPKLSKAMEMEQVRLDGIRQKKQAEYEKRRRRRGMHEAERRGEWEERARREAQKQAEGEAQQAEKRKSWLEKENKNREGREAG